MTTTNTELNTAATATETTATEAKKPMTKIEKLTARVTLLTKRIADDTAELPKVQAELAAQEQIANVKEGSVIVVKQGRADTVREVEAVVKATRDGEGVRQFKVEIGEGFDAEIVVVQDYQVIEVKSL